MNNKVPNRSNKSNHTRSFLLLVVGFLGTGMLLPGQAWSRLDPLRVIRERSVRAEILIVLDTSGSMAWRTSPATATGSDCGGQRTGTVDLCGDGLCSGNEGSSSNPCSTDCPVSSNASPNPGFAPACNPGAVVQSRMFILKRVLQNLLPQMQKSAAFGLVTFAQSGYFRYYGADPVIPGRKVTVFLTRSEMIQLGAWDAAAGQPRTTFTRGGTGYTLLSAAGLAVDRDSLYSREDDLSRETRFRWSQAGLTTHDGSHTWHYRGSYFTFLQAGMITSNVALFGTYRGPQFTDAAGQTWIYHRFNHAYTSQGITAASHGVVREPISAQSAQGAQDLVFQRIMAHLNLASNGGIWSWGGTPTGLAIQTAQQHFLDRQSGSGPFSGAGVDPASACRARFVLLLTDGQSNQGISPAAAASQLFNNTAFAGNPVKTLVVALPGLPSSAVSELDSAADMGDDGQANSSKTAYYASDETTLLKVIREAFFEMLQGDYTTTAPGVASSGQAQVPGDLALVASTRFPGWKGRLRALDLTSSPPAEVWEAGELLSQSSHLQRRLYTGYPDSAGGRPVPLLASDGAVNLAGGCQGCGATGIRQLWSAAGATPPPDSEITAVVLWLAGKNRDWKLGPILRSAPAVVGRPPRYDGVAGHDTYSSRQANRERLIYVTSNDGLLHAFRLSDGSEAFAYLPPNLLPAVHALWKRGGQDPDPAQFRWVLASSPRVEDIPPASAPSSWTTQLVLTMGPGAEQYVVLDITSPSTCRSVGCTLNDPPFHVLIHSRDHNNSNTMGETWSVPALFYRPSTLDPTRLLAGMGMGSGYGPGTRGDYYNSFDSPAGTPQAAAHSSSGAVVEFAVLADTAAAVDAANGRQVIATYQADLAGRLVRYQGGRSTHRQTILSAGGDQPLYHSPAVLPDGSGAVMVATASGSPDEVTPIPGAEATLFMREERAGSLSTGGTSLTCGVSQVCSGGSGCPGIVPQGCIAPSTRARPVGSPLLLKNNLPDGSSQREAFYLLYDPPTSVCGAGSTWLVRMAEGNGSPELVSSTRYAGVRATGLSMVGGRIDLAVAQVGQKGKKATVFTVMNTLQGAATGSAPYVEIWKEVSRW